ncbi:MAG TPA: BON domain-containing protein [Usitatibacter sp.]|nr:BON domain-containing protein [Usitatibacter sp.]
MTKRLLALLFLGACAATLPGCFPAVVAGAGTAAVMANDRRTTGSQVEDENIELKIAQLDLGKSHVNATSYNGKVLLTGEAYDEATRASIEEKVRKVASVKEVVDELQIAGNSSYASRSNDTLITSNVKTRMVNNPRFNVLHIKVVTEAGTVYLMGLVTPEEADAAVEVARTTSGVSRVVKVFEYIGK